MTCQSIREIDPANARQFIACKPIQKCSCARTFYNMFGEGRGVHKPHTFTNSLGLIHSILPPAAAAKASGLFIKVLRRIEWAKVIGTLPSIHPTKLRATGLLPIIGRCGAQRAGGRAFFIRVVQNIDVIIAFFVFAHSKFGGHPITVAFWIKTGHVNFSLSIHHHLRHIIAGAPGRCDAKAKAFRQPHIAQTRRRPHQWVSVRGVANRAVKVVFQPTFFTGRNPVDHRHILFFNPVEREGKEIRSKTVRHPMFKPGWSIFFINPKDPAATFLTNIALRIRIPNHRMFWIARRAVLHQGWIFFQHHELMFNRNSRNFNAQHFGRTLRVIARGRHHMLRRDHNLLIRRDKVATLFYHLSASHLPMAASPFEPIGLPSAFNRNAQLACTFGHRHGDIGWVNIAVGVMIQRAFEIFSADQGPFRFDFVRRHKYIRYAAGFCSGGIELIFVHPLISLCHAQITYNRKARIQTSFSFEGLVKID